jgi:colicin import membrane protein
MAKSIKPPFLKEKLHCIIKVKLFPGGDVIDTKVIKSSGNAVFDRSAENALRKAEPLPVPNDPVIFRQKFKTFDFIFNPQYQ